MNSILKKVLTNKKARNKAAVQKLALETKASTLVWTAA